MGISQTVINYCYAGALQLVARMQGKINCRGDSIQYKIRSSGQEGPIILLREIYPISYRICPIDCSHSGKTLATRKFCS